MPQEFPNSGLQISYTMDQQTTLNPGQPNWTIWLRRIPFLGHVPALTGRQWQILGVIVLVSIFANYNLGTIQLALPQIRDGLGMTTAQLSLALAIIRLGDLLAFVLLFVADQLGRQRVVVITTLMASLLMGATALVSTVSMFVTLQFLVSTCFTTIMLLGAVMIAEEFPPQTRGWGIGVFMALASLGIALASVCFAFISFMPFGWRTLYVIGFCPVFLLPFLYHRLPESTKFIQQQPQQPAAASLGKVLRPVTDLVRAYPGRFMASGLLFFLVYLAGFAAVFYNPTYLQEAHHWQPWHVSLLMMSAGLLGFLGSIVAGLMGDRVGRKRSTAFFLIGAFCFIVAFYNISGLLLPILWAGMAFYVMGGNVALNTLQTELFPTSYRATATGALAFVRTLGSALSLAMHGILFALTGSQWFAITLLAFLLLPTPLILALTLPETSGRPLEEISPER